MCSSDLTLELALAGLPFVAAYRLDGIARLIVRHLVRVPKALAHVIPLRSALLPNLVLGEAAIPEFIDDDCTVEKIVPALAAILTEGPARARQIDAFARLDAKMREGLPTEAGQAAADAVLALLPPA